MSIEAMKQALEALEEYGEHYKECRYVPYKTLVPQPPCTCGYKESVIALRQAIEQEIEQEPVAYTFSDDVILAKHWTDEDPPSGWTPLYTAPPKQEIEQEPVAWMTNSEQDVTAEFLFSHVQTPMHNIPLYEAPPKREWVCKKCGEQNVD